MFEMCARQANEKYNIIKANMKNWANGGMRARATYRILKNRIKRKAEIITNLWRNATLSNAKNQTVNIQRQYR